MKLKKAAGVLFTIGVGLVPVLLWVFFNPNELTFSDTSQTLDIFAKLSALSAFSLLSLNIILSARLSIFERLFLGLDRAYRAHRLIGGTVLILVMLHAVLITAKYSSISLLSGYEYLKPNLDFALMLGKLTLAIMMTGIVISIYIKVKYQWFVMIQRVLGATIFMGAYHALFVTGSDLRDNKPLFVYLALLGGVAVLLYIYRSLFHKSVKAKLSYIVESIAHKEGITIIWLRPLNKALAFYAGQFAFFQFRSNAVDTESHPFSISSGSDKALLRIAAKASGDYTALLPNVHKGDLVSVEGPYGHFSFTKIRSTRQVWVAGGIGITPFLSMAHSLTSEYQVTLYYCVSTISQAIFLSELESLAKVKKCLNVVVVCDDQNQRISAQNIIADNTEDYLLCAPPAMMHDLKSQLTHLGISKNNIYYEDFALT